MILTEYWKNHSKQADIEKKTKFLGLGTLPQKPLFWVLAHDVWSKSNCLLWTENLLQCHVHLLRRVELNTARNAPVHKGLYFGAPKTNTSRAPTAWAKKIWSNRGEYLREIHQNRLCEVHNTEIFNKCGNSFFWDLETINEFIILRYCFGAHIHYEYPLPFHPRLLPLYSPRRSCGGRWPS